jgi:hypothetical protein
MMRRSLQYLKKVGEEAGGKGRRKSSLGTWQVV